MVRIKRKQQALLHSLGAARHERGGSGADRLSRRRVDERLSDRFHRISRDGKNAGGAHSTHQETDRIISNSRVPCTLDRPVRPTPRLTPSLGKKLKLGFFCASSTIQDHRNRAGLCWALPFRETEKKCGDFVWFEVDCVERHGTAACWIKNFCRVRLYVFISLKTKRSVYTA